MKKKSVLFSAVLILFLAGCASWFAFEINDPVLSPVGDGVYRGLYASGPVSAAVDVTIKDHRYDEIALVEHKNGLGKKAEAIVDQVMEKQTLEVDVISGATLSSMVILKAIELAIPE